MCANVGSACLEAYSAYFLFGSGSFNLTKFMLCKKKRMWYSALSVFFLSCFQAFFFLSQFCHKCFFFSPFRPVKRWYSEMVQCHDNANCMLDSWGNIFLNLVQHCDICGNILQSYCTKDSICTLEHLLNISLLSPVHRTVGNTCTTQDGLVPSKTLFLNAIVFEKSTGQCSSCVPSAPLSLVCHPALYPGHHTN